MIEAGPQQSPALACVHGGSFPPSEVWSQESLARLLRLPGTFALLDERGGMVVARVAAAEGEILTLAVLPGSRRRGIGAALLSGAIERCAQAGAETMFLEVSTANSGALALYRQIGFSEVGWRRQYYADGSDAVVLRMALKPGGAAVD